MGKCSAITDKGARCKALPMRGEEYCYVHHPDHQEERRRHGAKGGKRGGRGRPVAELAALRAVNADIRRRLLEDGDDKLQPGVAAVAIQSINTDIRAVSAALKAKEVEELESRIEALEQAAGQRKDRADGEPREAFRGSGGAY
jgi:hypothetical protein